ncbi:MAG: UDP-N-acetylmuramate--L-alanine ligase [Deltaproteobacteria bacterium]|nr:UDP-N-acetylmuramate--L-alanine ligase [Deltaproteobacteria bacterium]
MSMFQKRDIKVHFVGIGGMGMCGIAEVLKNLGYPVTGSDILPSAITEHLEKAGCLVHYGHAATNIADADVVVVSSAIKGYNPEVEAAKARQIPVIPRAEMLGELMRMKYGITVAGSHGKTTTTTMIAHVLMAAGLDPTAVIGGRVNTFGLANARLGTSEYLVAEADESDGSFLKLPPTLAVVTNIDPEHLDHYGDFEAVKSAFIDFINRVPFYGTAVLCLDHPVIQQIMPEVQKPLVTYGTAPQATYRARNVRHKELSSTFIAWRKADELGEITIPMPGMYNVQNALAVLAVADFLGVPFKEVSDSLAEFDGIQRRFTLRGEVGGVTIIDDFGHHPTEVRATLNGARAGFAGRRIIAAFQPHRFSRTRDQFHEFARSFYDADKVVICDVFAAGEEPIDGADSESLVQAVKDSGHKDVSYVAKREDVAEFLEGHARAGDIVITLGAGDIQLTCNELIELLEKTRGAAKHKNLAIR